MLKLLTRGGGQIGVCGTCLDARGIGKDEIAEGTHRGTMDELAEWTTCADSVLVL